MEFFPSICLAVFLIWAISVAGTDLAMKKVPNARLAIGAKLLLLALAILALNSYMGTRGESESFLNWNFYLMWGTHVFWAFLAGVILWYGEIWPAGDAKFYTLVAAWLPVINPFLKNFPNSLFLSLLVNIFVAASFAVMGRYIASGIYRAGPADFFRETAGDAGKRFRALSGKAGGGIWAAPVYVVNMTFFFLLQQILHAETRHFLAGFFGRTELLFFFLFFLWDKISRFFKSRKWMYAAAAGFLVYFAAGYLYFYDRLAELALNALFNVFRFSLLLFFGRFMLEFLMEKKDSVCVGPDEIEPGMTLSASAAHTLKGNPVFEGAFDDCFKDGLSEEQVGLVRDWLKRLPVRDPKIEIVRGRPFAAWIAAGAAISLLFDANLVRLLE